MWLLHLHALQYTMLQVLHDQCRIEALGKALVYAPGGGSSTCRHEDIVSTCGCSGNAAGVDDASG